MAELAITVSLEVDESQAAVEILSAHQQEIRDELRGIGLKGSVALDEDGLAFDRERI